MNSQNTYLLESIKVQHNKIYNLPYHQDRIARGLKSIFDSHANIDFQPMQEAIQDLDAGLYKLRVVYNEIYLKYELLPYSLKRPRSLQLLTSHRMEYSHKYLDRTQLDKLYKLKRNADDILIVKNGMITDSYYCNVALSKAGRWLTPKAPLLKGTKRQQLLEDKQLTEEMIYADDLKQFDRIRLFNAMIEFGEIDLDINQII